jgi:hypothetical protein
MAEDAGNGGVGAQILARCLEANALNMVILLGTMIKKRGMALKRGKKLAGDYLLSL